MRREWSGWIKNRQWSEFEREARQEPNQMLADTVGELLLGFPEKTDRKALKRVLYFLEKAGYAPADPDREESPEPSSHAAPFERALLITADQRGVTSVAYGRERNGKVRWLHASLNGTQGIVRAEESECSLQDANAEFDRLKRSNRFPTLSVEMPPTYILWRLKKALRDSRRSAPGTIAYWRSIIDAAEEQPHPSLQLPRRPVTTDELRVEAAGMDCTIYWRLELGAASPILERIREANLERAELTEDARKQAMEAAIEESRSEVFPPAAVEDHKTRLLDAALALQNNGKPGGDLLMSAYDDLAENGPESSYARGLVDKTIILLVRTMTEPAKPR